MRIVITIMTIAVMNTTLLLLRKTMVIKPTVRTKQQKHANATTSSMEFCFDQRVSLMHAHIYP